MQWGDRVSEAAGSPLVEVPSIRSSASLWDITKGREYEVLVSNPRVDGSLTDDGTFLLQQVAQVTCWQTSISGPSSRCCQDTADIWVWVTPWNAVRDVKDVFMQGKPASRAQAEGKAKGDAENVRFAAEGKFLSGHIFVSDGVIHGLPSAAKEVRPSGNSHLNNFSLRNNYRVITGILSCVDIVKACTCFAQVVGNDLHLTAIVGAKQLKTDGAEYNIEAEWVDHTPKPPKSRKIGARIHTNLIAMGTDSVLCQSGIADSGSLAIVAVWGD